jgi:1,4-alpha-glucan branching enzyme
MTVSTSRKPYTLLGDQDIHLFNEGTHRRLAERLGSHAKGRRGGYYFAVWAPNAAAVSVVGDFNDWDVFAHPLKKRANGTRSAAVVLQPGNRYAFKYVAEDGTWFNEVEADAQEHNEYGQLNSVVQT